MSPIINSSHALNSTQGSPRGGPAFWYWSIRCVIAVLIVVGNSIIIYLILTRRRLHTTTNWLTLSLAVADLLIGIALTPAATICYFTNFKCNWNLIAITSLLFFFVSVGNLFAITVDRYVAVVIPHKYSLFKTARVRTRLVLCAWIVPGVPAFIPLAWQHSSPEFRDTADRMFQAIQTIGLIFGCVLMLLAYLHITLVMRRQRRVIRSFAITSGQHGNIRSIVKSKREAMTSLRVYGLILVFFVACWSLSAYRYLCYSFKLVKTSGDMIMASRLFVLLNSAINPVIYALMKRDIRAELTALVGVPVEPTDTTMNKNQQSRQSCQGGSRAPKHRGRLETEPRLGAEQRNVATDVL